MSNLTPALIGLSVIGFLMAVVTALFTGPIMGIAPGAFSRGSINLALITIALALVAKRGSTEG